jgi:integrase
MRHLEISAGLGGIWGNGGHPRQSKSFSKKAEAEAWAREVEGDIDAGHHRGSLGQRKSMYALLDEYIRVAVPRGRSQEWEKWQASRFQKILPFVGRPVSNVTADDVCAYRNARLKNIKSGSVRRELAALSQVFALACSEDMRWLRVNPMAGIWLPSASKPRTQRVGGDLAMLLAQELGWSEGVSVVTQRQRVAVAFPFARETGMRRGECANLRWTDTYLDEHDVHVSKSKNGTERDVPLTRRAEDLSRSLSHSDQMVFGLLEARMLTEQFAKARDHLKDRRRRRSRGIRCMAGQAVPGCEFGGARQSPWPVARGAAKGEACEAMPRTQAPERAQHPHLEDQGRGASLHR